MGNSPLFDFSPITEREFELPDTNRVAVWVIPNIEHFHIDKPNPFADGDRVPDAKNYGWRDYGNRVGIWRLMEILDRHDIRATVALNAQVCDEEPEVVQAAIDLDWEFMGHGLTNTHPITDHEDERAVIRATRDRIASFTGKQPMGWLGPGLIESFDTLDLLSEEGFRYVCDWCNDDQPYPMNVKGELISIPYSIEINDIPLILRRNYTGSEFEEVIKNQFDVFYREGKQQGNAKVMALSIHPFITGQPHRSQFFDNALEYITDHDDVWLCTGGEIAEHYYSEYM